MSTAAPVNLGQIVSHRAAVAPDAVLLRRREGSAWHDVTSAQFRDEVEALARGVVAAGVRPGDRVGLMAKTRYEWTLCDAALWTAGAVVVPVYETSSPDQVRWVLEDSGAVACFVEGRSHEASAAAVLTDGLAGRSAVWRVDALEDLVALGAGVDPAEVAARRDAPGPDDPATLIYTSGTTGRPKGCVLTHGNFLAEVRSAIEALPELFEPEDASTLLFLPLAHVFGRMIQVAVLLNGTVTGHSDTGRLLKDLDTFRPTFVLAVPRIFEKVHDSAQRKAVAAGRGRVFERAAATAIAWSEASERGRPGLRLVLERALFDRLVYGRLRAALGGQVQWAVSGGAPLGARLAHFFRGVGVTVLEGYGLTETTAACCVNTRSALRVGTVGRALPRFEIRIADDGEVQVRGGHVTPGYWGQEEATAAAFTADGWFRTGDLGSLDADGYLSITGRAKEIIVTSAGKNVSPSGLEDVVRSSPLVSQCVVVGDARPHVAALVTLDAESVAAWLAQQGRPEVPVADLVDDPQVHAEVQAAVDAANRTVSAAEAIRRFRVLPVDLTEADGTLTPSLKVKRAVVHQRFAADIEAMYAPARARTA
ncbi:AMP-dependent synthetase/ligase [Vallicoccus soli]|uniref:Acyl-CoA synthetase n=1 Tax=Vallicoccus soli TaxID=2339232 RepID=A0A3A3YZB2_9ACTN|nr:AMP-dependent synthetase/ligase [Vallicoccus soli]RJK97091.1 long-chain fatty acid--CoA ligase [Vallicoccus soli]